MLSKKFELGREEEGGELEEEEEEEEEEEDAGLASSMKMQDGEVEGEWDVIAEGMSTKTATCG
jgi:hypothetical protein